MRPTQTSWVLIVFSMLALVSRAEPSCIGPEITDKFVGQDLLMRKSVNHSRVFYLNDEQSTYYHLLDPRVFLYDIHQIVHIVDIKPMPPYYSRTPNCEVIGVEYSNELLGSQSLMITLEAGEEVTDAQLQRCLEAIFITDPSNDTFNYYVLNEASNTLHSSMCDHLPTHDRTFSKDIPSGSGVRKCSVCFKEPSRIPDIQIELDLGKLAAKEYLIYNIPVEDRTLQDMVASVGHSVLSEWPLPLRGYDYRFIIIDKDYPSSFAAPAGTIFITTGLLNALEGEAELTAVLAHEIGHVEFRHGLRQFKARQEARIAAGVIAVFAGAVIGGAMDNASWGLLTAGVAAAALDVFSEISISGYLQEFELEADQISAFYLSTRQIGEGRDPLARVLKKLRYHRNEVPYLESESAFSAHPPVSERLISLEAGLFTLHDPPLKYRALDDNGQLVAELTLLANHRTEYIGPDPSQNSAMRRRASPRNRIVCYAEIKTTRFLGEVSEVKHFEVSGAYGRFDNELDTKLVPGQSAGVVFYYDSDRMFEIDNSMEIKLELRNVKRCERVEAGQ